MLRKTLLLVATVLLSAGPALAAAPSACFVPQKKFDNRFLGNWEVAEWKVRYSIIGKGREICLYARDAEGNEWFEISEPKWDGKVLAATFLMPATKWRTQSRLTAVDKDKLRDDYTARDGKHTDYWTRRK